MAATSRPFLYRDNKINGNKYLVFIRKRNINPFTLSFLKGRLLEVD